MTETRPHDAVTDPAGRPTYFSVADRRYFVGAVVLINSLRLSGNDGDVVIFDAGLTDEQRDRIAPACRIVPVPPEVISDPMLLKPLADTLSPEGPVVIIDSDILVTGDLAPLVQTAREGGILAFPDRDSDRWFAEWEQLFELSCPPRRQEYASAFCLIFSTIHWPWLLGRYRAACEVIPFERTRTGGAPKEDPFWDSDQDALNSLLMSEVDEGAVTLLSDSRAPSTFAGLRAPEVVDPHTLRCRASDGSDLLMLHYGEHPKPWIPGAWRTVQRNPFSTLMARVCTGPGVTVPLAVSELPPWLRPNVLGRTLLRALDLRNRWILFSRVWLVPRLRGRLRRPFGGSPDE